MAPEFRYLFPARERAVCNKSCNLIGSWSGRNFLIRTGIRGLQRTEFRERGYRQSLALFTPPSKINQRKFISVHLQMARKVTVSKFNKVFLNF